MEDGATTTGRHRSNPTPSQPVEPAQPLSQQTREAIERILQRPPPDPERIEELSRMAKEFYQNAIEKKRRQRQSQLGISAAVVVVVGIWWWFR